MHGQRLRDASLTDITQADQRGSGGGCHAQQATVLTLTVLVQAPLYYLCQKKLKLSNDNLLIQGINLLSKDLNPGLPDSTAQALTVSGDRTFYS